MTHSMITDPTLRKCYASELDELRQSSLWKNTASDERYNLRLGLDSGIWSLQKAILRKEIVIHVLDPKP